MIDSFLGIFETIGGVFEFVFLVLLWFLIVAVPALFFITLFLLATGQLVIK